jgi:polar amino acid transport system substrate-binding protein
LSCSGDILDKPGGEHIDQFLSKPVSPSHLFDAVMAAFGVETGRESRGQDPRHFDMHSLRPVQGAEILLVEDNEINQQVASELLEQYGFRVDIAHHGQEAIDKLDLKPYDCVLMDIQMPVMDGYTATAKLRADERFGDLPILAMTANATVEDRDASLAHGMNDHIAKPISPRLLFEALLRWIQHAERELPEGFKSEAPEDEKQELPEMPGIDTGAGIERMGGKVKSYLRLLERFQENQAHSISQIEAAVAEGDGEAAVRLAHTLKGVAGNIGADELNRLASGLEAELVEDSSLNPALLRATGEELERVLSLIRNLVTGEQAEDKATRPLPSDLGARLRDLMSKLEDYESEAEDVLLSILDDVKGTEVHSMLQGVKNRIGQYDMEAAAEELKPVMEQIEARFGDDNDD